MIEDTPQITTKVCTRCSISKPLDQFRPRKWGKLNSQCRDCENAANRESYWKVHEPRPVRSVAPGYKYCPKCDTDKPRSDFSPDNRLPSGLQSHCKQCQGIASRLHREKNAPLPVPTPLPFFKVCTQCHEEKPCDEFYVNPDGKQGFYSRCKACMAEYWRERRQQPGYNEYQNQWHKNKYATDPEFAQRDRELSKAWAKANPLKAREQVSRRRALKQERTRGIVNYKNILERDGYICHICGLAVDPQDVHFDHVIPLSRGGSHSEDNLSVTHSVCNSRKHDKLPEELTLFDRRGPYIP